MNGWKQDCTTAAAVDARCGEASSRRFHAMSVGFVCLLLATVITLPGCAGPQETAAAELERRTRATAKARAEAAERYTEGKSRYENGDVEDAAESFAEAASLDPRSVSALMGLGITAYHQERWGLAVRSFEAAGRLAPARPEPRLNLGTTLERVGRLDQAITAYETGLALDPGNLNLQENLARALVRARREPDRVAELVDTALEQEYREDWRRWLRLQSYRLRGQALLERPEAPPTAAELVDQRKPQPRLAPAPAPAQIAGDEGFLGTRSEASP